MRQVLLSQDKEALVDDEDYDRLVAMGKWYVRKDGCTYYAVRNIKNEVTGRYIMIYMHRVIMNPSANMQIDHINGNGLDNRKQNLRIVIHRQNQQNRHDKITSQYPGVSWHKGTQKWQAQVVIDGRQKYLGCFTSELDAYKVYKEAVESLGEQVIV